MAKGRKPGLEAVLCTQPGGEDPVAFFPVIGVDVGPRRRAHGRALIERRIGQVDIVLKRYGREGLYTGRLAAFMPTFVRHEAHTLEISKVFVRKEYQRQVAPISLLCRGIGKFISHNPHYRGLIGFISHQGVISNASKRLKAQQGSGTVAGVAVHAGGKGVSDLLRMGGTVGEDSVLAFVDINESRAGLRYCMGKTASERFTEYHQPRHDRAA